MAKVFIGVGSNLGDRAGYINRAIDRLRSMSAITVKKVSSIIESEPQGIAATGKYLNGVVKLETDLGARELLNRLQRIEEDLGRVRLFKNSSRTIDLDILLYNGKKINEPGLKVPHPRMLERAFVIGPLLEIEPELIDTINKLQKTGKKR